MLQTTQQAMLRRIVATGRIPGETYVDWLIRATRRAKHFASEAGIRQKVGLGGTCRQNAAERMASTSYAVEGCRLAGTLAGHLAQTFKASLDDI
jgi:hypothetical protein